MKSLPRLIHPIVFALLSITGLPATIALGGSDSPKIAEGQPWSAPQLGLTLTPPVGWQIQPDHLGKTLVLQPVRKDEKIKDYSKPIYNRNITVAVVHEARPIDETEALTLRRKLEVDFGQAPGVTSFQVLEHRFIDYRQKADGILLYTSFQLNGFAMSQMHIFVSGSKNSALLSYTDLADAFQSNDEAMTLAWNSMLSIELEGVAPKRYQGLIYSGSALGVFMVAGCLVFLLRRRSAHQMYEGEEDKLYRDDEHGDGAKSSVSSLATSVAKASTRADSHDDSDLWSLTMSEPAAARPSGKKKSSRSSVHTVW